MEALLEQFSLGLFFWQTVIFLVLLFILKKFAWKPILNAIDKREESIKISLEKAKLARKEIEQINDKSNNIIKKAIVERDAILKEAYILEEKILLKSKNQAQNEAKQILELAKVSIKNEKIVAIMELKNQLSTISISIAEKILQKELSDKKSQINLVENLIKQYNLK